MALANVSQESVKVLPQTQKERIEKKDDEIFISVIKSYRAGRFMSAHFWSTSCGINEASFKPKYVAKTAEITTTAVRTQRPLVAVLIFFTLSPECRITHKAFGKRRHLDRCVKANVKNVTYKGVEKAPYSQSTNS